MQAVANHLFSVSFVQAANYLGRYFIQIFLSQLALTLFASVHECKAAGSNV